MKILITLAMDDDAPGLNSVTHLLQLEPGDKRPVIDDLLANETSVMLDELIGDWLTPEERQLP